MILRFIFIAAAAASLAAGGLARAADSVRTEHAQSRLIPERNGFVPGEVTWFAFAQELEPGWHVYWRNPGDSGLPLDFQWTLPEGFTTGGIFYPPPERIPIGPLANFGHTGAPVFMTPIIVPSSAEIGSVVDIELNATWLICEDICVPEEGVFTLSLPVTAAPDPNPDGAAAIAQARQETPKGWVGTAEFDASPQQVVLKTSLAEEDFTDAFYFPKEEGVIEPSAPQKLHRARDSLVFTMKPGFALENATLESFPGVLVLTGADGVRRGYELSPVKAEGLLKSGAGGSGGGLPGLVAIAFLGGLILNLMPCVFPVVFIKAAALIETAHETPAVIRRDGLLYTAGVAATFAALGALLLLLRAGGEQLGWGFHLQSPAVVMISAYVLFLVGLNLAGVFHVGQSLQNIGSSVTYVRGAPGAFLTGMLAVFVAAPCIGPLMSAPLAAAMMLPPAGGMAIFVAMALGLAAPYLALSFIPGLGKLLPRPGRWMVIMRQALAFPVFGAAAFFLWVLSQQTGATGLAKGLAGSVMLAFAAWLFELGKAETSRALAARIVAAIAIVAALSPVFTLKAEANAGAAAKSYGALTSVPYEAAALAQLRAGGEPVFVDFTAAWCVTCQFNKMTILSKASVERAFSDHGVTLMAADWTNRDPAVTEMLESFGASGVPLYVYYPPSGEPQVLPLPLSEKAILAALGGR
jgi:thiol:disulfide interchange protein DsbD